MKKEFKENMEIQINCQGNHDWVKFEENLILVVGDDKFLKEIDTVSQENKKLITLDKKYFQVIKGDKIYLMSNIDGKGVVDIYEEQKVVSYKEIEGEIVCGFFYDQKLFLQQNEQILIIDKQKDQYINILRDTKILFDKELFLLENQKLSKIIKNEENYEKVEIFNFQQKYDFFLKNEQNFYLLNKDLYIYNMNDNKVKKIDLQFDNKNFISFHKINNFLLFQNIKNFYFYDIQQNLLISKNDFQNKILKVEQDSDQFLISYDNGFIYKGKLENVVVKKQRKKIISDDEEENEQENKQLEEQKDTNKEEQKLEIEQNNEKMTKKQETQQKEQKIENSQKQEKIEKSENFSKNEEKQEKKVQQNYQNIDYNDPEQILQNIEQFIQFRLNSTECESDLLKMIKINLYGKIIEFKKEEKIEVSFIDKDSQQKIVIDNQNNYNLGDICQNAFILASNLQEDEDEQNQDFQSKLLFKSIVTENQWELEFGDFNVVQVSISTQYIAILTSENDIKIYDHGGNEIMNFSNPQKVITIDIFQHLLAVVVCDGSPLFGYQNLSTKIMELINFREISNFKVSLNKNSFLKWFGFSDDGILYTQDTDYTIRMSIGHQYWSKIHQFDGIGQFWLFGVSDGNLIGYRLQQNQSQPSISKEMNVFKITPKLINHSQNEFLENLDSKIAYNQLYRQNDQFKQEFLYQIKNVPSKDVYLSSLQNRILNDFEQNEKNIEEEKLKLEIIRQLLSNERPQSAIFYMFQIKDENYFLIGKVLFEKLGHKKYVSQIDEIALERGFMYLLNTNNYQNKKVENVIEDENLLKHFEDQNKEFKISTKKEKITKKEKKLVKKAEKKKIKDNLLSTLNKIEQKNI